MRKPRGGQILANRVIGPREVLGGGDRRVPAKGRGRTEPHRGRSGASWIWSTPLHTGASEGEFRSGYALTPSPSHSKNISLFTERRTSERTVSEDGYSSFLFNPLWGFPVVAAGILFVVDQTTHFYLANPNNEPLGAIVQLVGLDGAVRAETPINLPASGFTERESDLLFGIEQIDQGYVVVQFDEPGGIAFSLIQVGDTLLGNPPSRVPEGEVAYSAQLAHGSLGGVDLMTLVRVINLSDQTRSVELTSVAENGTLIQTLDPVQLQPGGAVEIEGAEVLGLSGEAVEIESAEAPGLSGEVSARVGSLIVSSDGNGVVGDVVFGESGTFRFGAQLLLQHQGFNRALFGHVANSTAEDLRDQTFTGIALFNPNLVDALVEVVVIGADGVPRGQMELVLKAGERLSRVLPELVPESAGQVGGYVLVQSSLPLIGQELFGNNTLDYLSAVPPTAFSQMISAQP